MRRRVLKADRPMEHSRFSIGLLKPDDGSILILRICVLLVVHAHHGRADVLNSDTPPVSKACLLPLRLYMQRVHESIALTSCLEASLNPQTSSRSVEKPVRVL